MSKQARILGKRLMSRGWQSVTFMYFTFVISGLLTCRQQACSSRSSSKLHRHHATAQSFSLQIWIRLRIALLIARVPSCAEVFALNYSVRIDLNTYVDSAEIIYNSIDLTRNCNYKIAICNWNNLHNNCYGWQKVLSVEHFWNSISLFIDMETWRKMKRWNKKMFRLKNNHARKRFGLSSHASYVK